jgi:hypothetical protein
MNANRSSVDRSAQWRSSMARTTGRSWPSVSRVDRTASNSRDWLAGSSPCETRPPSVWGNNRDSSLRGPVSNALTRSAPSSRVSPRSASTTGAYGSAASPRSRHPPRQHDRVPVRGEELRQQAGLADPRVAADQHDRRFTGGRPLERALEPGTFNTAADEGGGHHPDGHADSLAHPEGCGTRRAAIMRPARS